MAINLGVALGSIAEGGFNTYTKLKDQQDKAADREQQQKLINMQLQKYQDEKDQQAALQGAYSSTIGQVGKPSLQQPIATNTGIGPQQAASLASAGNSGDAEFDKALAQSDIGVLNQNAQRQGQAIPTQVPVTPSAPSIDQARAQYVNSIMGNPKINPKEALAIQAQMQQMDLGQYQLTEAKRKIEAQTKWDTESKKLYDIRSNLLNQDPVNDPTRFFKEVKEDYAKFHPNDKVDMLHGKIIVTDPSGATKAYTPQEAHSNLLSLLDDHTKSQFMMMLGSPEAYLTQANKETELGLKKKEVENTGKYQDVMGAAATKTAANGAITANATAELSHAHAQVYNGLLETAKTNKAAGEAMQPFIKEFTDLTPEEQSGDKGQAVLLKAATAGARVSKDLSSIVATLRKPDRSQVNPEESKAAYTDLSNAGTDPKEIQKVKDKWPNVFGEDPLVTAIKTKQAEKNKQATALPVSTLDKDDMRVPVTRNIPIPEKKIPFSYRSNVSTDPNRFD